MEGTAGTGAPGGTPSAPEETTSRWDALVGNRKRLLIALALLLLAAAVAVGSTAIFTSSSANPGNEFTAGTLEVTGDGSVILSADNMVPGDTANGTTTISNTGDVSGTFSLTGAVESNETGPGGGQLSQVLQLRITQDGTQIYNGPYAGFPGQSPLALGSWAAGEDHAYDITVTFPEGGPSDNQFQGSSTSMEFTWDAVSD